MPFVYVPLLPDGEQVEHEVVKVESRREGIEHDPEHHGHHVDHGFLSRILHGHLLLYEHGYRHEQCESADERHAEHWNLERQGDENVRSGEIIDPAEEGFLADIDDGAENAEECKENRHLQEHGEASSGGIHSVLLVELHHFHILLLLIVFVLLAKFIDHGLQLLHALHGLHAAFRERMQQKFDENGENDDDDAEIRNEAVQEGEQRHHKVFGEGTDNEGPAKMHCLLKTWILFLQDVIVHRTHEQGKCRALFLLATVFDLERHFVQFTLAFVGQTLGNTLDVCAAADKVAACHDHRGEVLVVHRNPFRVARLVKLRFLVLVRGINVLTTVVHKRMRLGEAGLLHGIAFGECRRMNGELILVVGDDTTHAHHVHIHVYGIAAAAQNVTLEDVGTVAAHRQGCLDNKTVIPLQYGLMTIYATYLEIQVLCVNKAAVRGCEDEVEIRRAFPIDKLQCAIIPGTEFLECPARYTAAMRVEFRDVLLRLDNVARRSSTCERTEPAAEAHGVSVGRQTVALSAGHVRSARGRSLHLCLLYLLRRGILLCLRLLLSGIRRHHEHPHNEDDSDEDESDNGLSVHGVFSE